MKAEPLEFRHRFIAASIPEAPTLLLLHGTGGDENDLLELGRSLASDAALLSPRGKVLENGMPRFFRRLAEGVFDQEDLALRAEELARFVESAAAHYGFDGQRVIAVGYSNGANIAASLLLRRPGILVGSALFHPMVPFVPESLPDLKGTSVFLGAGQNDPIVPVENTTQLASLLQAAGADVSLYWHPGGHSLIPGEVEAARQWLHSHDMTPYFTTNKGDS
jgi:phospholipase/carboxylesterase